MFGEIDPIATYIAYMDIKIISLPWNYKFILALYINAYSDKHLYIIMFGE